MIDIGTDARMEEVRELIRRGLKINAIKAYRQVTGADLHDAKHAVEGVWHIIQAGPPAQQRLDELLGAVSLLPVMIKMMIATSDFDEDARATGLAAVADLEKAIARAKGKETTA